MPTSPDDSASHWMEGLRQGDSIAAQEVWNRYFARLATLAQARLRGLAHDVSGQDIALSAMKSVLLGVQEDRYPELTDSDSLWPLLVTITARKAISQQRRQLAEKRNRNRECAWEEVQEYVGVDPTPEFAAEVADHLEHLLAALGDPTLCEVVEMKLGGYTHHEIAERLGCTDRTVKRKLRLIRQEWLSAAQHEDGK